MAEQEGTTLGVARAKIVLDSTDLANQAKTAAQAFLSITKASVEASKETQGAQKIALATIQQTTVVLRAQQAQITATTRAESQERIQQARAEASAEQQAARAATATIIEEEKRKTTAFNAEIRERERVARQSQVSTSALGRNAATFAGAAFGGPIGGLVGAVAGGSPALAAGLAIGQGARAAAEASEVAVAYDRQRLAALSLAGSQAKLNDMLAAYKTATGGIVSNAQALSDVTNLQAIGFAKNAAEVERFVRAARGISIAKGTDLGGTTNELALAIANQSTRRFDQLGLSIAEVNKRIEDLRANNTALTREQAFQEAVLEVATEKYAKLTTNTAAQATGMEKTKKATSDLTLEIGKLTTPLLNVFGNQLAKEIDARITQLQAFEEVAKNIGQAVGAIPSDFRLGTISRDQGRHAAAGSSTGPIGITPEQQSTITDWSQARTKIAIDTNNSILAEERQFGEQRAKTVADYNTRVSREAEDYANQRVQAEKHLNESIADIHADAARRELKQAEDLARTIAQAQADSTERLASLQADHARDLAEKRANSADKIASYQEDRDESIADKRKESLDRLAELESNYNENRSRAEQQYQLSRQEAATRLDGRALFEMDARHKLESEQADDAHKKDIDKEKENLQKAIEQVNESYQKRLTDEQTALDKSIKQSNEAYGRQVEDEKKALDKRVSQANAAYQLQLEEARANDTQRITDMQDAFDEQQTEADTERGIRLGRQQADFNADLAAQDAAHQDRLNQIATHGKDERDALDEEFKAKLAAEQLQVDGWVAQQNLAWKNAKTAYDDFMKHVTDSLTNPTLIGPPAPVGSNPGLDSRRQQLTASRNALMQQMSGLDKNSADYLTLLNQLNAIDLELNKLGGASTASIAARAGTGAIGAAAAGNTGRYAYPMPALAATGSGGRSLSIGNITNNIYAVPAQTANDLVDIIDQRILRSVQTAARGM